MRVSRYIFSERLNPLMAWVAPVAAAAPGDPRGAAADNPWMRLEQAFAGQVSFALEEYRRSRDRSYERLFAALYGRHRPAISGQEGARPEP
jgi:hypothetical protein